MPPTQRIQVPTNWSLNNASLPQKRAGTPSAHLASMPMGKSQLLVCGQTIATPWRVGKPSKSKRQPSVVKIQRARRDPLNVTGWQGVVRMAAS